MEGSHSERIIVLVDMDCFYVQVEQKLCPEYQNKPCAVVQYKNWKGGGIIAVNYEARAKGVTRSMRGDEALKVCPDIHLFRVPEIRGKADLTRYREAGAKVLDVLCEYSDCVERASIDEAYLDMTTLISSRIQNAPQVTSEQLKNTFVVGFEGEDSESRKEELEKWLQMIYEEEHLYSDRLLAYTAAIVEEMRTAVYEKTGYRCSAGIAHNKMLAKLSCGLHKPNKQTVLPQASIQLLFKNIPIKKVRNLGGKLGEAIAKKYNAEKMGDLIDIAKSQLVNHFGEKTGNWLYNLVRGIDNEPVTSRQLPKSIGCGKNFPGKQSLGTKKDVVHWLKQLAAELEERLLKDQNDNRRFARLLTVSVRINENGMFSMVSRSCPIHVYNSEKLAHDALAAISKLNTSSSDMLWKPSIWTLSMAASKFEDRLDTSHCNIESYFTKGNTSLNTSVASSSSNCMDIDQSSDSANKLLNYNKNETSDRSIVNYFKKIQDPKVKSSEKVEIVVSDKDINEENTELDSFLSVCHDMNSIDAYNNESCDSHTEKTLTVIEDVESILSNDQSKPVAISENKEQSSCNDTNLVESSDSKFEKKSVAGTNSETTLSSDRPVGFFARKLKEPSKISFDIEFEKSCDNSNDTTNVIKTSEVSNAPVIQTVSSDNQSKPLGFFARKLKEKIESNFTVVFESSCDSLSDEPVFETKNSENQKNCSSAASFSISLNEQSSSNVSDVSEPCINLDPELTKLCEQCNKRIPVWEETEHLDYHFALNMSKELTNNHRTSNTSSNINKNVTQKSRGGRKRGSATKLSSQSKKSLVKTKTIDSFFKS